MSMIGVFVRVHDNLQSSSNCTFVNFSKRRYLKPFRCLDITQVHAKKQRWRHQRRCLGEVAPRYFIEAHRHLKF